MSLTALLLVLAAAFAHAGWNLAAKSAGAGGPAFVWLYSAAAATIYLPFAAVIALNGQPLGFAAVLGMGLSALLHTGYFLLLQHGYAVGDMSVVYPLARGTGPLLSVLAAVLLFGERPGLLGLLGAGTVVVGVLVIGGGGRAGGSAVLFALLTGVMIAAYTLWDAYAVKELGVPPLVLNWGSAMGEVLMLAPYAATHRSQVRLSWRLHRRAVLAVAVLSPLAYILVLVAVQTTPVSLIAPARELSIVIGGIAAWRLFGEKDPVRRIGGSVVVLAGVAMLALA
ncbi:EamA family transporter [Allokutzneria albata]|uniref:EamA-like transporter family protein n=1 Tax=Allokutzneria albata TaxID=211114 RepID=A0A1H0C6A6_ALLAB|nr:EamA family transporter [Allokutzneria albata]SDN53393.1 EamA-like transporter family protein [Allokutzneria albata]